MILVSFKQLPWASAFCQVQARIALFIRHEEVKPSDLELDQSWSLKFNSTTPPNPQQATTLRGLCKTTSPSMPRPESRQPRPFRGPEGGRGSRPSLLAFPGRAMESGCWFGGEFEDSVFEERPERRSGPPASYCAKRCEPQENKATNIDHLTTVLYLQFAICSSLQNLEKTIFCLQKLISLHPFNPWNWGKLAEAYLNLGPALSVVVASSQKQSSFTSSDKIIKSCFPGSGKDCLLCFSETLPEGLTFSMDKSSSNSQKNEKALKNIQDCMAKKREAVLLEMQMKACASFIRTRLLLQLTQPQQTSFALERNLRTQREIEDKMKGFGFKEDTLLLIAEVMGEDIIPEKIKDEVQSEVKCVGSAALTALVTTSSKEFEDKWFRKIKDHFCPFENQFHAEIQILA
ncbi:uncharacterized protein C8orf76 homolog isoform X3 [Nycticebus coucang]|uniref:uncharacterized protein C8orf76 homolog isoform X3 n=1 Tax=Nycticebus coucang TaxID=9470 RepID=UPI00234E25D1|nr:uncharacterized protein C8orf76 homolog isoform X3 [Nycticebus coucang]